MVCVEKSRKGNRGLALVEAVGALALFAVVAAIALPTLASLKTSTRASADNRNLSAWIRLAAQRAASNYTHARVHVDLGTNTYWLEVWNKTAKSGAGCWQTDGDLNACTPLTGRGVQRLSDDVSFGYGDILSAPGETEVTLSQAPICYTGFAGETGNTNAIPNSACIEFDSRGVPRDPRAGEKPDADSALFITDGESVYATTVLASGTIQNWYAENAANASWQAR